jgi:hypothetical protein
VKRVNKKFKMESSLRSALDEANNKLKQAELLGESQ